MAFDNTSAAFFRQRVAAPARMARHVIAVTSAAERRVFALVALQAVIVAVALPFSGYALDWRSTLPTLLAAAALFAIGILYRTRRPSERIAAMTMGTSAMLLFSMSMALANYLAIRLERPLIDGLLADWDRAFGFDWPAMVAAVQGMPWLKITFSVAYVTTLPQIAIVVVVLALSGRLDRLGLFMLSFCISALMTVAFWAMFPSFGAFAYYWEGGLALSDRGLIVDADYARELYDLRAGRIGILVIDELTGLIAFPSFHTAIAVLAAWFLWPVRFVGGIALGLNLLVVLSVPFDGGHHLVDVPAGILTALAGIAVARWWLAGAAPRGVKSATAAKEPAASDGRAQP